VSGPPQSGTRGTESHLSPCHRCLRETLDPRIPCFSLFRLLRLIRCCSFERTLLGAMRFILGAGEVIFPDDFPVSWRMVRSRLHPPPYSPGLCVFPRIGKKSAHLGANERHLRRRRMPKAQNQPPAAIYPTLCHSQGRRNRSTPLRASLEIRVN
jgi:hypothetical protein